MSADILDKDLTSLFGLDEMSAGDQETFLDDVGGLILESVVTKLAVDMDDFEMEELHNLVTTSVGVDNLFEKLEEKYSEVNDLFREEVTAFRKEALSVLA